MGNELLELGLRGIIVAIQPLQKRHKTLWYSAFFRFGVNENHVALHFVWSFACMVE